MTPPNGSRMRSPVVSEADAFYLKVETPTMPSRWAMGLSIEGAGQPPLTIDDVRDHVESRLEGIPWLSWRISGRGRRPARYRWVDTTPLPIDELVVHEPTRHRTTLDAHLSRLVTEPLGLHLPLWRLRLVDLDEGDQGLVLDGHHAFAGGFVVVEIFDALFGEGRPPATPVELPASVPLSAAIVDRAWDVAALARRTALRVLPGPTWEPAQAGPPLVGPLSSGRKVLGRRLPIDRIEAIGAATGASTTRVVTALVARALEEVVDDPQVRSLRALFPRGTQEGPVTGPGNAARSSILDLPLHLPPGERLAALKESFARNATAGPPPAIVVDVVLSFQPLTPDLSIRERAITGITTSAPLRICSQPLTRLTVVVQRYRDSMFLSLTADEASLSSEVDRVADALFVALEELAVHAAEQRDRPQISP